MKYLSLVRLGLLLLALVSITTQANAQSGDYDLSWWTVDGGGVTAQAGTGGYSLGGTIGQPDAATWQDTGTSTTLSTGYSLTGGFWVGSALPEYVIYLPVLLRGG